MTLFLIFSQYFSCSKKINKFEIYVQKLLQQDIFLLRNKKKYYKYNFFRKKKTGLFPLKNHNNEFQIWISQKKLI